MATKITPQNTPKKEKKLLGRRQLITGGTIVGAASLAAACDCGDIAAPASSIAQGNLTGPFKPRKLKMVTSWPKDFPGLGTGAQRMADMIRIMSGGTIDITLYAAGELVPAFESFDAVASGAADLYHAAEYYWVGKSKAFTFFTAIPYGMTAAEIIAWTEFGGGQQLWDKLSARFNIKAIAAGNTGHQTGGWFKTPITSLEDMRGRTVRMPGMGGEVLRRIGASAVALPGDQIYLALQSGAIDGTEWVGPWNDLTFGFYREAKYYYGPGFHEPGAQLATGINLDLWNDFSDAEKALFTAAAHQENHRMHAEYAHYNAIALERLKVDHQIEARPFPDEVMEALAKASYDVLMEFEKADDPLEREIFESYRNALREGSAWSNIGDAAYLQARQRTFSL